MRLILLLHRYLGVVIGLVMALWCLSGFVMMYQGYPRLLEADRLQGLSALQLHDIHPASLDINEGVSGFSIEMLNHRPVLKLQGLDAQTYDLADGEPLEPVSQAVALAVAKEFAAGRGVSAEPYAPAPVEVDQWTLDGVRHDLPLWHLRFNDAAATELYVRREDGQAVQVTTRRTRLFGYLGAVPHWLYPTVLRRNGELWDQVVVWTSLVGVFLTVTGLYVGIARFKRLPSGRWSPYRSWHYWHHIVGLVFGLLTLTWVASGLFTMNPWGFLDTEVGLKERSQLTGSVDGGQIMHFLQHLPAQYGDIVQLRAAPLAGQLYVTMASRNGEVTRLDGDGRAAPLTDSELRLALVKLEKPIAQFTRLTQPDDFYYSGYERRATFPVYRVILRDLAGTTLYLDATTGQLVDAVDATARQSRWLRTGLHDFDFTETLRRRPLWDVVVLVLLAGVTVGAVTGVWLACRRVQQDLHRLRRRWLGRGRA